MPAIHARSVEGLPAETYLGELNIRFGKRGAAFATLEREIDAGCFERRRFGPRVGSDSVGAKPVRRRRATTTKKAMAERRAIPSGANTHGEGAAAERE